jgi:hypothetical protein
MLAQVIDGKVSFQRMLISLMAIMMAAQGVGQTSPFLGDSAAARAAASRIFAIVDRRPVIDTADSGGAQPDAVSGRCVAPCSCARDFARAMDLLHSPRTAQCCQYLLSLLRCWQLGVLRRFFHCCAARHARTHHVTLHVHD